MSATGVTPEMIYLATDRATVLARLRSRAGSHPDGYVIPEELGAHHFDHFEPPTADEGPHMKITRLTDTLRGHAHGPS